MNMSYDAANLTTPDIKWLGVRPSDLDRFNIPAQCRLPMTEEDIKTGRKLVGAGAGKCFLRGMHTSQQGPPHASSRCPRRRGAAVGLLSAAWAAAERIAMRLA